MLSPYYVPPTNTRSPKMPSNSVLSRMEELVNKDASSQGLTNAEIREIHKYTTNYGLNPISRYQMTRNRYMNKRNKYLKNLTRVNTINNMRRMKTIYKNLYAIESRYNFPHEVPPPKEILGNNYTSLRMDPIIQQAKLEAAIPGGISIQR